MQDCQCGACFSSKAAHAGAAGHSRQMQAPRSAWELVQHPGASATHAARHVDLPLATKGP